MSTTFAGTVVGAGGALAKAGTGTLTFTGHASTPGGTWQLKEGTLALGAGAAIKTGGLVESPQGTLAVTLAAQGSNGAAPIETAGPVRLAGALAVSAGTAGPAGSGLVQGEKITILRNAGGQPIVGTFGGLGEGATFASAGGTYRISYAGGAGHDVVLTVVKAPNQPSAAAGGNGGAGGSALSSRGAGSAGFGTTLVLAAVFIVAGGLLSVLVLVLVRRRRRGAG